MGRKGHGESQISAILKAFEDGTPISEICRKHSISERTFYRWKANRDGDHLSEAGAFRQIEEENQRLKNALAELLLENRALKDKLAKNRRGSAQIALDNGKL